MERVVEATRPVHKVQRGQERIETKMVLEDSNVLRRRSMRVSEQGDALLVGRGGKSVDAEGKRARWEHESRGGKTRA